MYANTYRIFLLLLLILASIRMSTANAQIQIQTITDLQLKLPFRPGSEWQTTAGWDGANHQQAWNWNAVDFVPVGRSCLGESVLAAAPGKVINVAYHNPHHEIEIAHDVSPYRTLYAHLNTVTAFSEGQRVTYGTQIGTCGGYPNFVPHLHFLLFTGTWDASDGIIPIPIDGISDQNRLKSNQRGLYSTNGAPNVPPNIPTLVSPANGTTLGSRSVTLQWQDTGDPDNGPNTYRNYSGWVWNAANTWSQEIPWQNATSASITVPTDGTYYWKVQSGDGAVGSGWTSTWSFTVHVNQPPNIPTLVSPANGTTLGSRSVTLQWQDTGDPDNGPNTYRNYSGWVWNAANTWSQEIPWQNATSASITVPADGTYYWKVQSGDGAVGSGWTSTWSFTIINIPNPPSELIQTVAIHDILTISWKDNSDNETGFNIYKWAWDGSKWEFLPYAAVGANATTFIDSNLNCNTDYFYQVSAYNTSGESRRADWVKATTSACPVPVAPDNLATSNETSTSVTLNWRDNSADEDGFYIYKWGWDGVTWDFYYLDTVSANTTSFTDTNLNCESDYYYTVSAYNTFGESGKAGWVKGTTNSCPIHEPTAMPTVSPPPTLEPTTTPIIPPTATALPTVTAAPTTLPNAPDKYRIFVPITMR